MDGGTSVWRSRWQAQQCSEDGYTGHVWLEVIKPKNHLNSFSCFNFEVCIQQVIYLSHRSHRWVFQCTHCFISHQELINEYWFHTWIRILWAHPERHSSSMEPFLFNHHDFFPLTSCLIILSTYFFFFFLSIRKQY